MTQPESNDTSWTFVALACGSVLATGLMGGSMPYLVAHGVLSPSKLRLLSLMNCFAGGVLLAAGMAHMLPDAMEDAQTLQISTTPTPFIFFMIGILLPFTVEKSGIVHHCVGADCVSCCVCVADKPPSVDPRRPLARRKSYADMLTKEQANLLDGPPVHEAPAAVETTETAEPIVRDGDVEEACKHVHDETTLVTGRCITCGEVLERKCGESHARMHARRRSSVGSLERIVETAYGAGGVAGASAPDVLATSMRGAAANPRTLTAASLKPVRGDHVGINDHDAHSVPFLLVVVLGFHSFVAGTSLGATASQGVTASIGILVGILFHKGFSGLALGMSFRQCELPGATAAKAVLLFACMTPIGIVAGTVANELIIDDASNSMAAEWVQLSFKGVAAGTFVYVAICEVLMEELDHGKGFFLPFSVFSLGVGAMTTLGYYV